MACGLLKIAVRMVVREAFVIMLLIWAFRWSKGIETPGSCSLLCLARAFPFGIGVYLMDGSKRAFDHLVGMRAQVQRCGRRARLEKICRIFRSRKATMRHAFHVHQKFRATDLKMGIWDTLAAWDTSAGSGSSFVQIPSVFREIRFRASMPSRQHHPDQHTTQLSDNIRPRDYLPKEPPNVNLLNR